VKGGDTAIIITIAFFPLTFIQRYHLAVAPGLRGQLINCSIIYESSKYRQGITPQPF
jgi:hypothetical protein